jgi:hypothetical protein
MVKFRKSRKSGDLGNRLESITELFKQIENEIERTAQSGKIAPAGCWIVRYQAREGELIGIINGNPMTLSLLVRMGISPVINILEKREVRLLWKQWIWSCAERKLKVYNNHFIP